eukprot:gene5848-9671_t
MGKKKNNAKNKNQKKQLSPEDTAADKIQRAWRFFQLKKKIKVLAKSQKKRINIIKEIISTEESYVKSLEKTEAVMKYQKVFNQKQAGIIFSNVTTILPFNRLLLQNLKNVFGYKDMNSTPEKDVKKKGINFGKKKHEEPKKQDKKMTVGETFTKFTPFLKLYTIYINNFDDAQKELKRLKTEDKNVEQFIKTVKKNEGEDLGSLLIKPIQRVPRYKLLLDDLLRTTPRGHFDYALLQKSIVLIGDVASHLNEQKRQKDSQKTLKQIQKKFTNFISNSAQMGGTSEHSHSSEKVKHTLVRSIIQPHRHLVKEGHLKYNLKGEWIICDVYLFTDILLVANCNDPTHLDDIEEDEENEILRLNIHLVFTSIEKKENPLDLFLNSWTHGETLHFQGFEKGELDIREWTNEIQKVRKDEYEKLKESEQKINEESVESLEEFVKEKIKNKQEISKKVQEYKKLLQAKEEKFKKLDEKLLIYEDKKLILHQILNIKEDISKSKEFISHCNKRLKKGAIQLSSLIEHNSTGSDILLSFLRKDTDSLNSYFDDGSSCLDLKTYLDLKDEIKNEIDFDLMTSEEVKNHYENEIQKLKLEFETKSLEKEEEIEQQQIQIQNQSQSQNQNQKESSNSTETKIQTPRKTQSIVSNEEILKKNETLIQLGNANEELKNENVFLKTQIEELKVVKSNVDEKAKKEAEEIIKKGEEKAKEILENAKKESQKLIEITENKISKLSSSENGTTNNDKRKSLTQIQSEKTKKLIEAADKEAQDILNKADISAAEIIEKAEKDANQILKSADKESKQILKHAESAAKIIQEKSVEDAKTFLLEAEKEVSDMKKKHQKEVDEFKKQKKKSQPKISISVEQDETSEQSSEQNEEDLPTTNNLSDDQYPGTPTPTPNNKHIATPRESPMLQKIQFFEHQKKLGVSPKTSPSRMSSNSFIKVPERVYSYEENSKMKEIFQKNY